MDNNDLLEMSYFIIHCPLSIVKVMDMFLLSVTNNARNSPQTVAQILFEIDFVAFGT